MMRRKEERRLSLKAETHYLRNSQGREQLSPSASRYEIAINLLAKRPAIHVDLCDGR